MPASPTFFQRIRSWLAPVGIVAGCVGCSGGGDVTEEPPVEEQPIEEQLTELVDGDGTPAPAILERFAKEGQSSVREAFLDDLPELVQRLPLLERRRLLHRWSADENVALRVAAGRALQSSFVAWGAADVVSALVADPDESVRRHAAVAAMIRRVPLGAPAIASASFRST